MGIGDLVAYLTVNHAGFRQGFTAAQGIATRGAAGITAAIAPVAATLAPLTAALTAAFGAGSAISAAKGDLIAVQKLEAVLRATGGAAGLTAKEIGDYASELQRATNFGDEVTVAAASILATFRNINGDNFKSALRAMQDMSTIMGTDLNSAAVKVGKALNDPIRGMTALTRAGVSFTEQQRQQIPAMQKAGDIAGAQAIILKELESEFGGAAAAVADPWTQLSNVIGDIGEQVGGLLLPHVNNLSEAMMGVATDGVDMFASLRDANQEFADGLAVTYATLGDQAYLWYLETELAVVQAGAAFGHFFTQELPVWLTWLSDNWQDVMFTIGDYTFTVFENIGVNIREAWQAMMDFISGEEVKPNFKGLTEGAVNAIKAMPDIPERIASDFEKSLQANIESQKDFLLKAQEAAAGDIITKRAEKDAKKSRTAAASEESATVIAAKDVKAGALAKGSADALSVIFSAGNKGIAGQQLAIAEEQVEQLAQANTTLENLQNGGMTLVIGSFA